MDLKTNKRQFVQFIGSPNYLISNFGEVLIVNHRHKGKIGTYLKPKPGGYKKQYLRYSIENKDYYAHRLVLEHFLGPCPENMQCAHLDGNPKNNFIKNLKWVTPKENSSHKIKHGTSGKGSKNSMSIITEKDVVIIRHMYSLGVHPKIISKIFKIKNATPIATYRSWKHVKIDKKILNKNIQNAKNLMRTSNERKNTSKQHISCCY